MRTVDRYRIEAELDSGGFGTVYRARHAVLGRTVALKLLHPSRESSLEVIERFLREARILSAISSPHVVQVVDAGMTDDRQIFLAMELLEGESLGACIHRAGPMSPRDAIRIARQVAKGLAAAHAAGIVHRDLKPANVFLARGQDGEVTAKVLDFGISKSRGRGDESVITMTGAVLGTPHYMAPEQLHGARDVDARADLYALAVCIYEMLSGKLPYQATTLQALIAQRLSDPPAPLESHLPHLPRALLSLVDRGLARDPDARFRTAAELDAALASLETASLPSTTPPQHLVRAAHEPSASAAEPSASATAPTAYAAATPSSPAHAAPTPSSSAPPAPRPSPYASHRPPSSVGSGAVVMASPIPSSASGPRTPMATSSARPPPPSASQPTGLLLLLGGAVLVIVALASALVAVVAVLVVTRESAAAPAPAAPLVAPQIAPQPPLTPTPAPVAPVVAAPQPPLAPSPAAPLAQGAGWPAPPVPETIPAPPPASPEGRTRVWVHSSMAPVSEAAFDRLFARAAPAIERCRRDVPDDVRLQVFVNRGGSIPISQPDVNEPHGDEDTARCVARAIRGAAPLDDEGADTIVTVMAHLEPR